MTQDIVPQLLESIIQEYIRKTGDINLATDPNDFAIHVGKILSDILTGTITEDKLPNGRMYFNIAQRILEPSFKMAYDDIVNQAVKHQEKINGEIGVSLKPIRPKINHDKVKGIVDKVSDAEKYNDVKWVLEEPVINFTQSIVDDFVKANTEFQYNAGLRPKVVRISTGKCCKWCSDLAGVYEYPDVPNDVYKRHQYCRCTVNYEPGDGKRQDVWSKKWEDIDRQELIETRNDFSYKKRYKIFYEGEQVNQFFEKESKKLWSENNKKVRELFTGYTRNGYININTALRDRQSFIKSDVPFFVKEKTFQSIKHMKDFIDKQILNEDIVVYRSIDKKVVEKQLGLLTRAKGKIFSEKAFSSTSPLKESVKGFYEKDNSVCIEYHISKGRGRGVYINSVSEFNNVEYEYLLNTDTKSEVIGFKKENDMDIIIMEVIDNESD